MSIELNLKLILDLNRKESKKNPIRSQKIPKNPLRTQKITRFRRDSVEMSIQFHVNSWFEYHKNPKKSLKIPKKSPKILNKSRKIPKNPQKIPEIRL